MLSDVRIAQIATLTQSWFFYPTNVRNIIKLGGTAGSVVPSCVFGVRNLRRMAKGEQDARRGSVFDV